MLREGLVNKKVSRFKTAMRMLAKDKDYQSNKDDVIEVALN